MKHEVGWDRVKGIARRRRMPVFLTAIFAAGAGLFFVKMMPPVYQSRTVVRIDDPRPGRDYVNPLVSEPDVERLKSARLGFLAQPVVLAAAAKAGYDTSPRSLAVITSRLDARQEGTDTFVVTFEDGDPAKAKAFLAALTESYALGRNGEMSTRAAAAAFLQAQVEEMRPRVTEAEAEVEKYRMEHYGALPDQLDSNLRVLDENEMTLNALVQSLDATHARRRDILAEARSPLRHQEESVARELSAARTRFTAEAPEVKALEEELARVRSERHNDEGDAAKRITGSRELRNADEQIARLTAQIGELRKRSESLRGRVHEAARHGEVLARMSVQRDVMRERFRSLVAKQEEARLASGMEAGVTGLSRVAVVEPAWASALPVKPSKPLFGLIALVAAMALGLGVGWVVDTLDRRVLAAEDVRVLTGNLPILAVVPNFKARAANAAGSVR